MYFTSGSDRAFEQLMQTRPGADHFDNGEAGAPEDCGTCRFYRPHWKYQFCVYEECPYQPGKLTALDGAVKFQVKGVDDEMAVFRVEKNRGYTVMSNHHLRNKDLSLKAKGLLSQMLSLPEDWDFTLKGLSLINREQIDAIRAAVRELEQAGYIVRSRERDSQGRLRGADYIIYEQPQPVPDSPTLENPTLDNPTQEKPTQEKPTQLNKDRSSKEKSITDGSNTDSIPILSPPSPLGEEAAAPPERKGTGAKSQSAVEIYREIIKDNIEYEHLCQYAKGIDRDMLDEIVDLLVETVCSARKTIRIAGDDYPAELVKSKLMKLNSSHIEFVFDCISKNTTEIRNDITKVAADAIVNPANRNLLQGSGTSRAIYQAAGEQELTAACEAIGRCDLGRAVCTPAFGLSAKYVFHAVCPAWHGGGFGEAEQLAGAYHSALKLAAKYHCESVAFPLLSSGNYGYPKEQAFRIAVDTITQYVMEHDLTVYLVLYDRDSLAVSRKLFASVEEYIDDHYVQLQ